MKKSKKLIAFIFCYSFQLFSSTCLENVQESFKEIAKDAPTEIIHTKGYFGPTEYTQSLFNLFGYNNHLQGVAYYPEKDIYILSGGDWKTKKGLLIFAREFQGKMRVFKRIHLTSQKELWHIGGINIIGNKLFLSIENMGADKFWIKESDVYVFDISDIENIKKLPESFMANNGKYGAIDYTYYKHEDYLFAGNMGYVDIYKKPTYENQYDLLTRIRKLIFKGSHLKVLKQCDGTLFLAGFKSSFRLIKPSKNFVYLYKLDINQGKAKKIAKYQFNCNRNCSFRGAVNILQENQKLSIISSKMFKESLAPFIKFKIFK